MLFMIATCNIQNWVSDIEIWECVQDLFAMKEESSLSD